ncbi:MAG TPA: hypothetical protein VHH88_13190 [Verrucomicrobiae bacterium]|nr:hypothetical protein [Verrucomicrobiae bacterium]
MRIPFFTDHGPAAAVKARIPEPSTPEGALQPPLSHNWTESLPLPAAFIGDAAAPWASVAERLANHLSA